MRVERLKEKIAQQNLDAILLHKPENRRYISGFTGSTGFAIITKDKAVFATDFRYAEQAKEQCHGFEIKDLNNEYTIYDLLKELNINILGIEDDFSTYDFVISLKEKGGLEIVPLKGLLTQLRMIKDENEIKLINKAAEITDAAFNHIIEIIKVGMTEKDVANILEYFMKSQGADGPSFSFIVASGKRSSMPHGVASEKTIEEGDFVTIDMGCKYKGYCSDMTRTFVMGNASDRQKEIYNTVLLAQEKALEAIKPGITGFELDKIARDLISDKGYGEYFGHSLGHGVGLEIHELPRLVQNEVGNIKMESGMVVTDEPGIYIPNFGGVRIEDLVVVTKDGYDVLSKSTKELLEINN